MVQLTLARSFPNPLGHTSGNVLIPYLPGKPLVAEFLTYSDRARWVLLYGTIIFGSLGSNPARPHLREYFDPIFMGEQPTWGRIINIFWDSASSSTLWYSYLWLALFQPRSATPPGIVLIRYFRGEQFPWGRIFNIFWQSASSSTLCYG